MKPAHTQVQARMLPQSIEAECGVLGSILIGPEAIVQVADFLHPEDFYRDAHQTLYSVMLHLYEAHEPADFITICDALERRGKLEYVGGAAYVTSLINGVPTSGNVEYYGRIVAQKALYRRLIHASGEIAAVAYEEMENALERAEQAIFTLGAASAPSEATTLAQVMTECLQRLDTVHSQASDVIGTPTGFRTLDVSLGGLQSSDLIIVAARPGMGKTAFALNIAAHAASEHQMNVGVFSLEMSRQQLGFRLLSLFTRIDQQRLRMGWVHDDEWERIIEQTQRLSESPIWIDDTPGLSVTTLRSKARRLHAQHSLGLLIVDYLQLMHATIDGKRPQNREQEVTEISRGLKSLAKELNVPVLALAQLSRAVEGRASKTPQLSDLRESGSQEQDADVVMFICREEMYNPENSEAKGTADIIIAKQRNGPVGTIRLGFEASQTRFFPLEALLTPPGEDGGNNA
jgi:replicative DNA helicase